MLTGRKWMEPAVSSAQDNEREAKAADDSAAEEIVADEGVAASGGINMAGADVDAVGDISWDIDFSAVEVDVAHASPPESTGTLLISSRVGTRKVVTNTLSHQWHLLTSGKCRA